jgi:hypothetical protein
LHRRHGVKLFGIDKVQDALGEGRLDASKRMEWRCWCWCW